MAKYVIVSTYNSYERIPRVLELFTFKTDAEAFDFCQQLAETNRMEFAYTDSQGNPVYAQAYENRDRSIEYRTVQCKSSRRI